MFIGIWIQSKNATLGRCHVYEYLNESLRFPRTILEMYSRSRDLLIAYFCSEKEGLWREKVVELCFKDPLAFEFHFHILELALGFEPTL